MTSIRLSALLLLLCTACTETPEPSGDIATTPLTHIAATRHFEFYSDPWINLHHFLYQWARGEEELASGRDEVPVRERSSQPAFTPEEQTIWREAVDFYRQSVAELNHFDDRMLEQKFELLKLNGDTAASPPDIIPGIAVALDKAMPLYLSQWWPQHHHANQAWIEGVVPLLERHKQRYVELTARIYNAQWPGTPRRVDVSAYANPAAGYTALGHIVIYSTDAGNQDLYALETVLHEAQHTREVGRDGRRALAEKLAAADADSHPNLWHSLIFATAGEFTRSIAEQEGLPEHEPYWVREGFQNFAGWRELVPLVNTHWLPVVRDETSPDAGMFALTADLRKITAARRTIAVAQHAMTGGIGLDQINIIQTLANCRGPDGAFQTQITSAADGRMRFLQTSDAGGFTAGIQTNGAWQLNPGTGQTEPADDITASFLRGHELHMLALAPETRWYSPVLSEQREFSGQAVTAVQFRDGLDGPVEIYYSNESFLPLGMQVINHTGRGEREILVHLSDWQERAGMQLFTRATFVQGDDEYHYEYTDINPAADADQLLPPAVPDIENADASLATITSDGVKIYAEKYFGNLNNSAPLVLLFHQGGSNGRGEYSDIAKWLNDNGFRAIAWDQRAGGDLHGHSNRTVTDLPEGVPAEYCDAYLDLQGALDFTLAKQMAEQVWVWGSSYSAALAVQLAAKNPGKVAGVVAFSPASGGSMAACRARQWIDQLAAPLLVMRPASEMAREPSVEQRDILTAAGADFQVIDNGVHGASMLLDERTGQDMSAVRAAVIEWLRQSNAAE